MKSHEICRREVGCIQKNNPTWLFSDKARLFWVANARGMIGFTHFLLKRNQQSVSAINQENFSRHDIELCYFSRVLQVSVIDRIPNTNIEWICCGLVVTMPGAQAWGHWFKSTGYPLVGWPGRYINVWDWGGQPMVLLQLKELFAKGMDFFPGSWFLSCCKMT